MRRITLLLLATGAGLALFATASGTANAQLEGCIGGSGGGGTPGVPAASSIGVIATLLAVLALGFVTLRRRGGSSPAGILAPLVVAVAVASGVVAQAAGAVSDDCVEATEASARECRGRPIDPAYHGTSGFDYFNGTNERDVMHGFQGPDSLYGDGGDDVICGGGGDDFIHGNGAGDSLYGGNGEDTIEGGDGNDLIIGDDGPDWIYDGDGFDVISTYGDGKDTVFTCPADGNQDQDTWHIGEEDDVYPYGGC